MTRVTQARVAKMAERAWSLMEHDAELRMQTGANLLAGVDEVGRGSLAGPLVAAAVILPHRYLIPGIDDSKVLTPAARMQVAQRITRAAISWSVAFVSAEAIDKHGLTAANMAAMRNAVHGLVISPDLTVSDGYPVRELGLPNRGLVHGDRLSQSIAAAACLAKVVRDNWMSQLGEWLYPGYGWERNAGYSTAEHKYAIQMLGVTPEHRRLFLGGICSSESIIPETSQIGLPFAMGS